MIVTCPSRISVRQCLVEQILTIIARDLNLQAAWTKIIGQENPESFLAKKILLCPEPEKPNSIKYRCAVTFPLASVQRLTPQAVGEKFLALLANVLDHEMQQSQLKKDNFQIAVKVTNHGWLDFDFCNYKISELESDRNLIIWLEKLRQTDFLESKLKLQKDPQISSNDLVPLVYIRDRCQTLLALAEREGLIKLAKSDALWKITSPVLWQNNQQKLYLPSAVARKMLWQICYLSDLITSSQILDVRQLRQLKQQLSSAWLDYVAQCNFCGAVAQQQPEVATARLGIIALIFQLMYAILLD